MRKIDGILDDFEKGDFKFKDPWTHFDVLMDAFLGKPRGRSGQMRRHGAYKPDEKRVAWVRLAPKQEEILNRAFEHVRSVPYRVSLRWLFYRLLQDGFYSRKEDYKDRFSKLLSRARHSCFKEWRPDTLEDETRAVIRRAGGYENADGAADAVSENILDAARIRLDHFYRQRTYVELWFEARAMAGQFEHFTERIDLVPMGGAASIPFKYELAQRIGVAADRYGKPVTVLYFGDEDEAGHVIQRTIEKDVRRWSPADFDLVWCGLTKEQARKYRIPISIEGKGFQWEALSHKAAGEIITAAVEKYVDPGLTEEVKDEEEKFEDEWREKLDTVLTDLKRER
jgi:hypothetical protein